MMLTTIFSFFSFLLSDLLEVDTDRKMLSKIVLAPEEMQNCETDQGHRYMTGCFFRRPETYAFLKLVTLLSNPSLKSKRALQVGKMMEYPENELTALSG